MALTYLLLASVSNAEQILIDSTGTVICKQESRCLAAVSDALKIAKVNKQEALRQMLLVYAEFLDPRLCFNIGRLYQQTGAPREAAAYFRKFLDSGAEQNPELLAKARSFLAQAEKTSQQPLVVAGAPPILSEKPRTPDSERQTQRDLSQPLTLIMPLQHTGAQRPRWRLITGSIMLGSSLILLGFGGSALAANNTCRDGALDQLTCSPYRNTLGVGSALLASGAGLAVAGTVMLGLPGKHPTANLP